MATLAALAILAITIGFALGCAGRFPLFAAAALLIPVLSAGIGIFGGRSILESVFLALAGLAGLQIGYAFHIVIGALLVARSRRGGAATAKEEPPAEAVEDKRDHGPASGYERPR